MHAGSSIKLGALGDMGPTVMARVASASLLWRRDVRAMERKDRKTIVTGTRERAVSGSVGRRWPR
jgi:hypothetical protein